MTSHSGPETSPRVHIASKKAAESLFQIVFKSRLRYGRDDFSLCEICKENYVEQRGNDRKNTRDITHRIRVYHQLSSHTCYLKNEKKSNKLQKEKE
jgi:hypothetical protein